MNVLNEKTRNLSREEHAAWTSLCSALLLAGAVTQDDMRAPKSDRSTPGRLLMARIREWGQLNAELTEAAAEAVRR